MKLSSSIFLQCLFFMFGMKVWVLDLAEAATILDVSIGENHYCAVWDNGQIKCWGYNLFGQLGLEDEISRGHQLGSMGQALPFVNLGTNSRVSQLALGGNFSCALLHDGLVKCWGKNRQGQIGGGTIDSIGSLPGSMGDNLVALPLGHSLKAVSIAAGLIHACAVMNDATGRCWGANQYGQLGLGDAIDRGRDLSQMGDKLPPINIGTDFKILKIVVGMLSTCALSTTGKVKCWGYNGSGLSDGTQKDYGSSPELSGDAIPFVDLGALPIVDLSAGDQHVCAKVSNGAIKCWGLNNAGQLGNETSLDRGKDPQNMGDALPFTDLGKNLPIRDLKCAGAHCCATFVNNAAKCWGSGSSGELGSENTNSVGSKPNQMSDSLPFVDLGSFAVVKKIIAGFASTCAILSHGNLKCWGRNDRGFLGYEDKNPRGDQVDTMGDNLKTIELE